MTIGIALPGGLEPEGNAVDAYVALAAEAASTGLTSVWFSQRLDADALGLAAVVGAKVDGIAIGTSVVPIVPRHPLVLAAQVNTATAASHGRFTLGLGLGAPALLEQTFGVAVDRPIRHLREYLTVLGEVFDQGTADFAGDTVVARTARPADLAGASRPSIVVAAMGPQALDVTGELADGTLPYLAGPRTLEEFIVPRITAAAERAGRPAPRIVVAAGCSGDRRRRRRPRHDRRAVRVLRHGAVLPCRTGPGRADRSGGPRGGRRRDRTRCRSGAVSDGRRH